MKTVLLNDKQRDKIIRTVKPVSKDYFSYQNLKLLTAVYDEGTKVYLTLSRYMSSAITRTGDNTDEYSYALLTPLGCFTVSCAERAGKCFGVFSPLPALVSGDRIQEMIRYYHESFSERRALEKEAESKIALGGKSFTEWYLEQHYFKEGAESVQSEKSRSSKGFPFFRKK